MHDDPEWVADSPRAAVTPIVPPPAPPAASEPVVCPDSPLDADEAKRRQASSGGVGRYAANAWGLYDMHGNVAEWTRSDFLPYPYRHDDGRNGLSLDKKKVVRGGSWRDRPDRARSAYRLDYRPYQRVYNVGFRVVSSDSAPAVASAISRLDRPTFSE